MMDEVGDHGIEFFTGADGLVVDLAPGAAAADFVDEGADRLEIPIAERAGVASQFASRLQPFEFGGPVVFEIEFLVVQHVQHGDLVPAVPQQLQPLEEPFPGGQQV